MVLVEHHVKYKEIHGMDETVWLTKSEHMKLHARLRKEGKCKIPVNDLNKISMHAYHRTQKAEYANQIYEQQERVKELRATYNKNRRGIDFTETMLPNIQFHEMIRYNALNGNVFYHSHFRPANGKKLVEVTI